MFDALWSIFGLLILLGILVTFHEWGHYWVAKKLGVKALRFSVGFGKPFWSRTNKHGTEFAVAPIPLGGYVKFVDEREGNVAEEDLAYAFNRQSVWKRILIVLAGPAANFILAILVYAFIYMLGIQISKPYVDKVVPNSIAAQAGFPDKSEIISVNGIPTKSLEDAAFALLEHIGDDNLIEVQVIPMNQPLQTIVINTSNWQEPDEGNLFESLGLEFGRYDGDNQIGQVEANSPAAMAGIKVGDKIIAIDGEPVNYWSDLSKLIQPKPNQELNIELERFGSAETIKVTPNSVEFQGKQYGQIGVAKGSDFVNYNVIEYGVLDSLAQGANQTWVMVERISSFLGKLVTGKLSVKNLGGPVSIAQGAGQTAQAGMVAFLLYLAMISVNLGFMNLLPIPMLDGGHLMYYLAELVRGKPVSEKIMELGMRVGIILVLSLMAIALFNDINRI